MLSMDCENPAVVDVAVASDVPPKVGGIELTYQLVQNEMKMEFQWQTIWVCQEEVMATYPLYM